MDGQISQPGLRIHAHSGFRVQGSGFRVQGSGFRVRVQGSGFRVQGSFRGAGFRVQCSGFTVHGSRFRVQDLAALLMKSLAVSQVQSRIWGAEFKR